MNHINDDHKRCLSEFKESEFPQQRNTVNLTQVIFAHFALVEHFTKLGYGVGGIGPRDNGLLESAVGRQYVGYGGKNKWTEDIDIVSTLMFGLINNHPFHDVNKRTALLISIFHLNRINRTPTVDQEVLEKFTIDIANNNLASYDGYDRFADQDDPEVKFISHFLRRSTRKIEQELEFITFADLKTRLGKFGFTLENPSGNYISVVKLSDGQRIAKIGFPSWTKDVPKGIIRQVREATGLTEINGIDSYIFFNGS